MLNNELFTEPLVRIDEFIDSLEYLGTYTNNGTTVPTHCREILRKWFNEDDNIINYYAAGRNTGAHLTNAIAMAYQLYKLLAFKNIHTTFGFPTEHNIAMAFYNTLYTAATANCYRYFNDMLCVSPWFLKHGTVGGIDKNIYVPKQNIRILPASIDFPLLGVQLYSAVYDVQNLEAFTDKETMKSRLIQSHFGTQARIISRFTLNGKCYGKQFTADPFIINEVTKHEHT